MIIMINEFGGDLFGKLMCNLLDIYQMKDWKMSWQDFLKQAKNEIDSKFKEWEEESSSENKIVFCEDGINDWQMVKIYKNNVLIDDKLENHTINALDLLEFLSENGLFELKIEQN